MNLVAFGVLFLLLTLLLLLPILLLLVVVIVDGETFKNCGLFPMILTFNVSPNDLASPCLSLQITENKQVT